MGILSVILALLGLLGAGISGGGGGGSGSFSSGGSSFIIDPPVVQEETSILGEEVVGGTDYGDAPAPYGIASHTSQAYDWLGSGVSQESSYGGSGWVDTLDDGVIWSPYNLIPGAEATISFIPTAYNPGGITRGWHQYVRIWIDWNQIDGWENTELIVDWDRSISLEDDIPTIGSKSAPTIEQIFTVPPDAKLGTTWLRARIGRGIMGSASPIGYGECEDYPVNVVPEPATVLLLSSGLFGLVALRKVRRKGI